ncbi:MAG: ABC transporter permease, partial [Propionibacteriaceae bacterium]|nr:ABC transporter permease [Propionibacteriaceae bacterium]
MILARVRLLVWKELLQLRRDVMLLRMLIIMPIAQLFLLGYVVSADVTDIRLAVVDLDHSSVSRTLDSAFEASGYFQITQRPASEAEL